MTSLEDQLEVLAALSSVDRVGPFAEPLVEAVRPHVFVKGGDHKA